MTDEPRRYTPPAHLSAAAAAQSLHDASVDNLVQRQAIARAVREAVDTVERKHAFVAGIGVVAAGAPDSATLADRVAHLVLPQLGDWCFIDVIAGDEVRCIASAHTQRTHEPLAMERLNLVGTTTGASPVAAALRTGKPQIGVIEAGAGWHAIAPRTEQRLLQHFGIRTYIIQPLVSRGRAIGAVGFLSAVTARYGAEELNTTGDVCRRVALALDNLLLHERLAKERVAGEQYVSLFDASRDAIYVTSADGAFVDVNRSFLDMFGYSQSEIAGLNAIELYENPTDRTRFRALLDSTGSIRDFEVTLRTRNGERIDCLLTSSTRRDAEGRIIGYHGIIHDITDRKRSEAKLQRSEDFTRTILSSVGEGVIVYDRELRYLMWNKWMEELTGVSAEEVLGTAAVDVFPHLREYGIDRLLERALAGENVTSPDTPYHVERTGKSVWVSRSYSPRRSRDGEIVGVVGIIHDVTDRKKAEEQLVHNALHDVLTDLPNRALFLDRLERLLSHSVRHKDYVFAVAFLDIDRFKVINDSLGHMVGDELLVAIARRLESCLRLGDTVARFGGDEFALLLSDVHDADDVLRIAERIFEEFAEPFRIAGHEVFASASMGIALSTTGYQRGEDVLRDADIAMYRAKGAGRGRFEIFDRNMHAQAVLQLEIETDLRRAIEREELRVHYQPIVDLADGRLAGFEALVRWQHPVRGLIPPDQFIPVAEETGAIVSIGWWVLREACRQMRAWDHAHPDTGLSMSVNLSGRQFAQPDLVEQLDRILTDTGFEASRLKLEITESAVMQNAAQVPATLAALRARGVQLCLDDFGTGYSSLSYLHAFPLDTLKIDRSFVSQLGEEPGKAELVQTIVELGRNLGMDAVAEGVESLQQLEMLRTLGPRHVQGFYFATPLVAAEAERLIAEGVSW